MTTQVRILRSDLAAQGGPLVHFLNARDAFVRNARRFISDLWHYRQTDFRVKAVIDRMYRLLRDLKSRSLSRLDYQFIIETRRTLLSRIQAIRRKARLLRRFYGHLPDQEIVDLLKGISKDNQRKQRIARLVSEMEYAKLKGFGVIFNTLTFNDHAVHLPRDETWDLFRQNCRTYFQARTDQKRPAQYFKMIGIPEYGAETCRFHIHCVMVFQTVRPDFVDPNCGRWRPYKREVDRIKKLWQHGNSSPVLVRWNNDRWSRAGWRWPWKNGKPITSDATLLARYVSKYLTKQEAQAEEARQEGKIPWRIRPTRNFGTNLYDRWIEQLTTEEKWQILGYKTREFSKMRLPGQMAILKARIRRSILRTTLERIFPGVLAGTVADIPGLNLLVLRCSLTESLYMRLCDLKLEIGTLPTPSAIWKRLPLGTSPPPGARMAEFEWIRKVEQPEKTLKKVVDFLLPMTYRSFSLPVESPMPCQ